MIGKLILFSIVSLTTLTIIPHAEAATMVWDGGGDGTNWSDPLNWKEDVTPSSYDDIIIDANSVVDSFVFLDTTFELYGSITIEEGDTLEIPSSDKFSLIITDGANINNFGTFVKKSDRLDIQFGGSFNNYNNFHLIATYLGVYADNFGEFINHEGATLYAGGHFINHDTSKLENHGLIFVGSPFSLQIKDNSILDNHGRILNYGTVALFGTLTNHENSIFDNYNFFNVWPARSFTNEGTINNSCIGVIDTGLGELSAIVNDICVQSGSKVVLTSPTGVGDVTFTTDKGEFGQFRVHPSDLPTAPPGLSNRWGGFDWAVSGLEDGDEITVTMEFPDFFISNPAYYKYQGSSSPLELSYILGDNDGDWILTITIVDDDPLLDIADHLPGVIDDPSGVLIITNPQTGSLEPPTKQMKNGFLPYLVECNTDYEIIFKPSNQMPACVKTASLEKLLERQWTQTYIFP